MFYVTYMAAELRRRLGRTILTALGLGIGVGLVVTVTALSNGLDDAQAKILEPLTGVGTDMSVSRPIQFTDSGNGPFGGLSDKEREQLRRENGGGRFGLQNLGNPGDKFSRDTFVSTAQLSMPATDVMKISKIDGVASAAGGLTLNSLHIEGTVPEQQQQPGQFGGPGSGGGPPRNINATSLSVSGVDQTQKALGAVTPGQIVKGHYFGSGDKRQAILNESYASSNELSVGDTAKLGGKAFTVIGIAETPLGGQSSDVYVKLSQLQQLSVRKGRVNTIYVRADSASDVSAVSSEIQSTVDGASVTTAADLAKRVSGTLVDAKNLASKLGGALAIVALLAAFLIASLLTLSSVTKRIREFGTLKALGWSQWLVVRQVTGESLFQGLLGGAIGVCLGIAGAAAIAAFSPSLTATVSNGAQQTGGFFGGGGPGPFGQGQVAAQATNVALGAPVSVTLVVAAVGLAVLGGLTAGAVGSLRASRLRPADALRHID
jgi:ABC-type antimicrobial peptide transport system permease subunit